MESTLSDNLNAALVELEASRKKIVALTIQANGAIVAGVLIVVLSTFASFFYIAFVGVALAIAGFVWLNKKGNLKKVYRNEYKEKIVASALSAIDSSMKFHWDLGLKESEFVGSQLFTTKPDRYHSEDLIVGFNEKTKFSFSEVHAEYKTEVQTKHGRQVHWHDILKGMVFQADFNKNFNGVTVVRAKDTSSAFGAWISDKIPLFSSARHQLVKLESPEFNNNFVVYAADQVEARYILTPAMMERLCELNQKCRYTLSASFIGTSIYIAFPLDYDYFEPTVFKSLLQNKALEDDINVLRFMQGIVKELDLNTRIWGKN